MPKYWHNKQTQILSRLFITYICFHTTKIHKKCPTWPTVGTTLTKSDQHQVSLNNITTYLKEKFMRINKMIT